MTLNNFLKVFPCALLILASISVMHAQAQPQAPSNKPQVAITATPLGSPAVVVKSIPSAYGQDINTNYVRTRSGLVPITDKSLFDAETYEKVNQSTQYLDGLGRPLQTVVKQITPGTGPKDMVMPVEYDLFGREVYKYLPYIQTTGANTSDGSFKLDPFHVQDNFYKNVYKDANGKLMYDGEQYLYGQTDFEASPLNRVNKVMAPGNSWTGQGKGTTQNYLVSTQTEGVRLWTIGNDLLTMTNQATTNIPLSVSGAVYGDGELYKNVSINEDGNTVVEYKDKEGQIILKKVEIGTIATDYSGHDNWLCTYYIYDDLNQLRFVIPPAAVEAIKDDWLLSTHPNVIDELCFRYEYDERSRMVSKKVPGAGWTEMVYDRRDRLVYTRDANMRTNSQWMVTLYDELNRPVITGMLAPCALSASELQPFAETATTAGPVTINGTSPSPIPTTMSLNILKSSTLLYQASQSITILEGVKTGNATPVVFEIVPGTPTTFSDQLTVTDPRPTDVPFVALTMTYYNDYSQLAGNSYKDIYNNKLAPSTSIGDKINLAPEPLMSVSKQSDIVTTGLVTGTKVRILDPSNLSAGKWLTTTMFYDNKGRVIQTQSENAVGGKDISCVAYDFTGKVLANYLVHNNPKAGGPTTVKTLMQYDFAGRLLNIIKTINDEDDKSMQIVSNSYDEMGNLKTKELGKKPLNQGPFESLDYNYNIRGWLKGINAAYSHPELSSSTVDRWFGMELNYDYGSETNKNQFNGNISSTTWRSKGDGVQRAYGYTYDKANRIMGADFSERVANSNSYTDNGSVNFDMVMKSDKPGYEGYDANGNIKGMTQWGMKFNSSTAIDQISYDYVQNSNKLLSVTEALPTIKHKLGDFADDNPGDDYGYDKNGNMITDLNKQIGTTSSQTGNIPTAPGAIEYNHLNLPWKINVAGKGTITYIYDATGNKLSKTVDDDEVPEDKITDYVGGMVYEQNILQFIPHEEGRTRLTNKEGVITQNYDYFIKDHLGNVRMVLTDESDPVMYPAATMETDQAEVEELLYDLNNTRAALPPGYPNNTPESNLNYPNANLNQSVAQVSGNGTDKKIGPSMALKVMAGDKFMARVSDWYRTNSVNPAFPIGSILTDIGTAVAFGLGSMPGSKVMPTELSNSNILVSGAEAMRDKQNVEVVSSRPKAFLNWVLYDDQFKYVDGGVKQVPVEAAFFHNTNSAKVDNNLMFPEIPISKSGYLYVFVSNETPNIKVYFDNLQVTHLKGPLLEETHYYPFGLTMAGISSKAAGGLENKKKYQQYELNSDFDLNLYESFYRTHDPQIGRFWQMDPKPSDYESPYTAMGNNPILNFDLLGDTTYRFNQSTGGYIGMFDLDAAGQVGSYGDNKTVGKGENKHEVWKGTNFEFADPASDAQQIRDGIINQLVFVSDAEVKGMLTNQGAFNYDDKNNPIDFYNNSTGGQNFDYSYTVIPGKYGAKGASKDPLNKPSSVLFLPEGDYTAHNHMNFGNYLWGASGYTLGFNYATLQLAAHGNSLINSKKNNYPAQWDSKDDQNSIKKGAFHASEYKYRIILELRHKADR